MSLAVPSSDKIKFYQKISQFNFLSKYSYKFLFIAFLGIHIPLIGLVIFVFSVQDELLNSGSVIIITLLLTLIATAVTLYFLNRLLSPLIASKDALEAYVDKGVIPNLPDQFEDEAGILMNMVQKTVTELDEMVRSKDDLISLISHDMRKPVGHMINYAEILRTNKSDEQVKKYADRIITSGNEQVEMLDCILGLLQQQGMELRDEHQFHQDIRSVIQGAIDINQDYAESKDVAIHAEMNKGAFVVAHFDLLVRVMNNLIHNAVKFSNAGSEVRIELEHSDREIGVRVIDKGIGFNPIDRERIFERFTDRGQVGTAAEVSTGLGLYVSKQIIEKHKGTISAKSMGKGLGSIFTIRLPLAKWSDHS